LEEASEGEISMLEGEKKKIGRIGPIRRMLRTAATGAVLFAFAGTAGAAAPTFGPLVHLSEESNCPKDPLVAPLRAGGYAVAWKHYTESFSLALRLTDFKGRLTGPPVLAPARQPAGLGADAAGHLIVVLHQGSAALSLQRFDAAGQPLGTEVALPISVGAPHAAAAVAADGRLAVVWQVDDRVLGRWFTAAGEPAGAEFEIDHPAIPLPPFSVLRIAATLDAAGRLVAAWVRPMEPGFSGRSAVVFRRFDSQGSPAGPAVEVSRPDLPLGYEQSPAVAATQDGGLTVAWERHDLGLRYRRFGAADEPLGPPEQAGAGGLAPRLASDGRDRVALVWQGASDGHARLLLLGSQGPEGPDVPLHPEIDWDGSVFESPVPTFLTGDRLAVAWSTFIPPNFEPTGCEGIGIYGRIVDLDPTFQPPQPAGPPVKLSTTSETGYSPVIAFNPDGGWVALWQASTSCGPLVSRAWDAAGQPRGPQITLAEPSCTGPTHFDLSITALTGGGFMAAWSAATGSIVLQRLAADGSPIGAARAAGPSSAQLPGLATRSGGGFLLAWIDAATRAVTVQPFHADGSTEGPAVSVGDEAYGFLFDLEETPARGGFVAAWNSSETQVVARRLGDTGAPLGPVFPVSTDGLRQGFPHVAPDVADGFAVAWSAVAPPLPRTSVARLRRFGPDGQPRSEVIDAQTLVNLYYDEQSLLVADLAAGRDGVLWLFLDEGFFGGRALRGLAVKDGEPVYPAVRIDAAPTSQTTTGSAAATPDGCGWIAAWGAQSGTLPLQPYFRRLTGGCLAEPPPLSLGQGRFRAEVTWHIPSGATGPGHPLALQGDSGAFWFFTPDNPELMLKVLDGRATNGAFWVFYATLTDVAFDLTILDTATGQEKHYTKTQGRLESRADIDAFTAGAAGLREVSVSEGIEQTVEFSPAVCPLPGDNLCLAGQYSVGVRFTDPRDATNHDATAVPLTPSAGSFWFFDPGNLELLLKIVDGTAVNGHTWFFWGGLSNVDFDITVTDTGSGAQRVYRNREGKMTSLADTDAF
jgi:hypothetical protein